MSIKIEIKRRFRGGLAKMLVIGVLTMIGIIAGITFLAFDYPANADTNKLHIQLTRTSSIRPVNLTIRRVTAYNVGVRFQTDGSPCIGAGNENLCHALAQGEKVCAANFVPLNTYLYIQNYGVYRVADRMNSRFENRVDIAMEAHQKDKAIKFGVQNLPVIVLD